MKASILALLALAVSTIEDAQQEMRDRLCEPTNLKFAALKTDLNSALVEGVTEGEGSAYSASEAEELTGAIKGFFDAVGSPQDLLSGALEQLGNHLGDRLALEVRAAIDEARAGA